MVTPGGFAGGFYSCPRCSGITLDQDARAQVRGYHFPLWQSASFFSHSFELQCYFTAYPATPGEDLPPGLGSFPVARRYQGKSRLISFPSGAEMFHFPELASGDTLCRIHIDTDDGTLLPPGSPLRKIHGSSGCLEKPPRGLSQPTTSFFAFRRQGIRTRCSCQLVRQNFLPSLFNCKMISRVISRFTVIYSPYSPSDACLRTITSSPGRAGKT